MTRQYYPSSVQIITWFTQMRKKDTTKVYAVKDKGFYRLRAFTDKHQKCGEISLGLTDKRLAKCLANAMTKAIGDTSRTSKEYEIPEEEEISF